MNHKNQSVMREVECSISTADLHDLKNLLSAIIGFADLALDDLDRNHPARPAVAKAMDAAYRAVELSDRLNAAGVPGPVQPAVATNAPSVLVVDDEAIAREILGVYLTRAGYRVRTAENGRAAIAQVRRARPDLVITDIVMPEQEGIQTIVELGRIAPGVPIVAVSGGGPDAGPETDTYLEAARRLGAQRVFRKPIDRAGILAAVAELTCRSV